MPGIASAIAVVREAIKENPQLKITLGVAALGAVTSIVLAFTLGDRELAIFGGIFVVGFMILLTIFTTLSGSRKERPYLAAFLIWAISIAFVAAIAMMFSSYFFCWPQGFGRSCVAPKGVAITSIDFLSEAESKRIKEGADSYWVIPEARRRSNRQFHIASLEGQVVFIAAIVDGYRVSGDGKTNFDASVTISDNVNGVIDVRRTEEYNSAAFWRSRRIPEFITPDVLLSQLNAEGFATETGSTPIIVALSCLDMPGNFPSDLTFDFTVYDNLSGTFSTRTLTADLLKDDAAPIDPSKICPNS